MFVNVREGRVKLVSTRLLIFAGFRLLKPPPGEDRAEEDCAAVSLKDTLSVGEGTPGNCQFWASDQLVVTLFNWSTPLQVTKGRVLVSPLVSTSTTLLPMLVA